MTKPYDLTCEFVNYRRADYSTVDRGQGASTITFSDPCVNDFTFSSTPWSGLGSDRYTGTTLSSTLTPYSVSPSFCSITYSCSGVKKNNAATTDLDCNDFNIVYPPNNSASGTVSIVATRDDYLNGNKPPGNYVIELCGKVTNSSN